VLPDLAEKLREAGVFRVMFPKALGGPEMPLARQIELVETLSCADASVGWACKINFDSGYFAAVLGEAAARDLYPTLDLATAGQASPNGRAVRVPGGFRVTGRWGFASGCNHADVLLGGCAVLEREDAAPSGAILAFAPASCWTIEDTWHSNGLLGSGSHHYSTQDLFVPDERVLVLGEKNRRKRFDGPVYAAEAGVALVLPMVGVPLGLMRRAIDEALKFIDGRVFAARPRERPAPMKDLARVKLAMAHAQMMSGAARAYAYGTIGRYWDEMVTRGECSIETRREVAMARFHALRTAREVTQLVFDTIGAPAVYETLPFGALLRDAIAINQHRVFSDDFIEGLGGVMFGGSPEGMFI